MVSDPWDGVPRPARWVLILVLMEYGLWPGAATITVTLTAVLILVLMEYGLWLNKVEPSVGIILRLNPCSNGIWSLTASALFAMKREFVVLILVLMEYGLWPFGTRSPAFSTGRLNPCSNGIWSLTFLIIWVTPSIVVLILVLMEYGLWHCGNLTFIN